MHSDSMLVSVQRCWSKSQNLTGVQCNVNRGYFQLLHSSTCAVDMHNGSVLVSMQQSGSKMQDIIGVSASSMHSDSSPCVCATVLVKVAHSHSIKCNLNQGFSQLGREDKRNDTFCHQLHEKPSVI